jgi:hypothetical protein
MKVYFEKGEIYMQKNIMLVCGIVGAIAVLVIGANIVDTKSHTICGVDMRPKTLLKGIKF